METNTRPAFLYCVYENPETSEIAGEYLTLEEAKTHPPKPGAEIRHNGKLLAIPARTGLRFRSWESPPAEKGEM